MRFGWEFYAERVAGVDGAAGKDHGHDACAAIAFALGVAGSPEELLEAFPVAVDLRAGGAEAGDFYDGFRSQVHASAAWKAQQVDPAGEDVFADLARAESEACGGQFVEFFGGEEVDLAEVGLGGVAALLVEVLHGRAAVRVAFDAFACEQMDGGLGLLGEAVFWSERDRDNLAGRAHRHGLSAGAVLWAAESAVRIADLSELKRFIVVSIRASLHPMLQGRFLTMNDHPSLCSRERAHA